MLFCNLWQDRKGNPKPEHEWEPEWHWKLMYPSLFPDSLSEKVGHQLLLKKKRCNFTTVYIFDFIPYCCILSNVSYFNKL